MDQGRLAGLRERSPLVALSLVYLAWFGASAILAALALWLGGPDAQAFLWRHFAGPWLAEASQQASATFNGVTAPTGYTLVSEAYYISTIVLGVLAAWFILYDPLDVPIDGAYVLALVPVCLGGALIRSLEDASLFCRPGTLSAAGCEASPLAYLAISPLVYITLFFATVLLTAVLTTRSEDARPRQIRQIDRWLIAEGIGVLVVVLALDHWLMASYVWTPLLVAAGAPAYRWLRDRGVGHVTGGLAALTLPLALVPAAYALAWFVDPWVPGQTYPGFLAWALVLAGAVTLLVVGAARLAQRVWPLAGPVGRPLGASVVGAHALDGVATFLSVCGTGSALCNGARFAGLALPPYGEKHPVSEAVLGVWDGWAFPLVKVALPVVFVVGLYWAVEDDEAPERTIGVYLLLVFLAGFVPGVRDVARAAMGV